MFCEVKNSSTYAKNGNNPHGIYVATNEKDVRIKYIFMFSSRCSANGDKITKKFSDEIFKEKILHQKIIIRKGNKRLIKELASIAKSKQFKISLPITDNYYNWIVTFRPKYELKKKLQEKKIKNIELSISFPDSYPFDPPFININKPKFSSKSEFIMDGGALCMDILVSKNWQSIISMKSLLIQIKVLLEDEQLDDIKYNEPYNKSIAEESFKSMAMANNWLY